MHGTYLSLTFMAWLMYLFISYSAQTNEDMQIDVGCLRVIILFFQFAACPRHLWLLLFLPLSLPLLLMLLLMLLCLLFPLIVVAPKS